MAVLVYVSKYEKPWFAAGSTYCRVVKWEKKKSSLNQGRFGKTFKIIPTQNS